MTATIGESPSSMEEQAPTSFCAEVSNTLQRCISVTIEEPAVTFRQPGDNRCQTLAISSPQDKKRRRPVRFLSRVVSQDLSEQAILNSEGVTKKRLIHDDHIDADSPSPALLRIVSPSHTVIRSTHLDAASTRFGHRQQDTTKDHLQLVSTSAQYKESTLSQALLHLHLKALAAETMQLPLRPILAKLMANPVHNRNGIFNQPVQVEGYRTVIQDPMDLGTIKQRLHSNLYSSKDQFAQDVRRVFNNAMIYNPPSHPVYVAANHLLQIFEEAFHPIHDNTCVQPDSNRKRGSSSHHACSSCQGRTCVLCNLGCIPLEPTLLICSGLACLGSKIKKGGEYFCTLDGNKIFCRDCYNNLPSILPYDNNCSAGSASDSLSPSEYKRNLIKRKNEEDVVESWVTCTHCLQPMHSICAFVNDVMDQHSSFMCPICLSEATKSYTENQSDTKAIFPPVPTCFTFLTGHELPEEVTYPHAGSYLDARTLPHNSISVFMEKKVQATMLANNCPPNAEKTIAVRFISDGHQYFSVPYIIQRHFRMVSTTDKTGNATPPSHVSYNSKAIALFQKFDGLDVCIFCLYVQEYDNVGMHGTEDKRQHRRIYIAYLDSVDYFRPRHCRTDVYQMMLISYLATARARGYEYAHIWSCPPSRGNSFVFWSHPPSQKTPNRERLLTWYHEALSKAWAEGIVTDIMSLYEFAFQSNEQGSPSVPITCPPLLDGDLWIEEACRIHTSMTNRLVRKAFSRKPEQNINLNPATQIAHMLSRKVMNESFAQPFLRPVNAAALKLSDYHEVVKKPMDLLTIYCRCSLGEYDTLRDVVSDVKLVVDNAQLYNPKGHIIHSLADNLWQSFESHLNALCLTWQDSISSSDIDVQFDQAYGKYLSTSLRLFINPPSITDSDVRCKLSSGITNDPRKFLMIESAHVHPLSYDTIDNNLAKRMIGEDTWLLAKRKNFLAKSSSLTSRLGQCKRSDKLATNAKSLSPSWLSDEVSRTMRRMRRDFFVCSLQPSPSSDCTKEKQFKEFVADLMQDILCETPFEHSRLPSSFSVADSRFALLEFSQYRHFQFDTLRRAKYSTSMLLYYLHNPLSPGIIPVCSCCREPIQNVRWHRFKSIEQNKTRLKPYRNQNDWFDAADCTSAIRGELCSDCFSQTLAHDRLCYMPIRVTSELYLYP